MCVIYLLIAILSKKEEFRVLVKSEERGAGICAFRRWKTVGYEGDIEALLSVETKYLRIFCLNVSL